MKRIVGLGFGHGAFRHAVLGGAACAAIVIGAFLTSVTVARVSERMSQATDKSSGAAPISSVLDANGSIRKGSSGSFDAKGFRMSYDRDGKPIFLPDMRTDIFSPDGGCLDGWDDRFAAPGVNDDVLAVAVFGGDVYVGGTFTTAGGKSISNIAKWDGSHWSSVGTGVNGPVRTFATLGGKLYVGGTFTSAGGLSAGNVATWDGTSWSGIAPGTNGAVYSIAVLGTDLYFAGTFTAAGAVAVNRIAKFDGSMWSALGTGVNGTVNALAISGSDVYAGGAFTTAGGVTVNRIAKWDGSAWTAFGAGANNTVFALTVLGSDLYAGGQFTTIDGVTVNRIGKWNGSSWSALGTGTNGNVLAMAVSDNDILVGGSFTTAGGVTVNRIARWDGSAWAALGDGAAGGNVNAVALSGSNVYIGGTFTTAGGVDSRRMAKWNGATWSTLGGAGLNGIVNAVALIADDIYVGGAFTSAGGVAASNIARWDGTNWSSLPGTGTSNGTNNTVNALAVSGTDLYVGGQFTVAGGSGRSRIAKWDGAAWSSLGSGTNSTVFALAVSGGDLYAGGQFSTAGVSANRIAKWNGTAWSALGTGADGIVYAVAAAGNDVYIGGAFAAVGGVSTGRVARWDGAAWSSLGFGSELDASVYALDVSGTDLYAGGQFVNAGGSPASNIAKWNGTNWSALGAGTDGVVRSVEVSGADVYVAGEFMSAGGGEANNIARWNGASWSALGAGTNGRVNAVAADGDDVYVGGEFTSAGCHGSANVGRYDAGTTPTPTPTPTPNPSPSQTPCAGVPDLAFGNNGSITFPVAKSSDTATAILVQPDGKTVLVGRAERRVPNLDDETNPLQDNDFGIVRYQIDGSLDTGFGLAGKVATDLGTRGDLVYSAALQTDGKLLVGGARPNSPSAIACGLCDFALVRYNPDGSLDTTFGNGGKVVTDLGGTTEHIDSIRVQPDGKIVAAGASNGFGIARYNPDGSLDSTFGNGGFLRGTLLGATDMVLQPDGKIVVTGSLVVSGSLAFGAARFNPDGSLDDSFGSAGLAVANLTPFEDTARACEITSDGKIVISGVAYGSDGSSRSFATVRFKSDGILDDTFAGTGMRLSGNPANPGYAFNEAFGISVEPDGQAVITGTGMIRYNVDGTLDTTFGTNGGVNPTVGVGTYHPAITPDGKIVATGPASSDFGMLRFTANGSLDSTFGDNGKVVIDLALGHDVAKAIVSQPDGKLVMAGLGHSTSSSITLLRVDHQGIPDPTFGERGIAATAGRNASALAIQSDGKIVAGGSADAPSSSSDFALARFNADGSLDTSFGTNGSGLVIADNGVFDEVRAVAIQPNGRITAAGYSGNTSLKDFALLRYTSGGFPDPGFGTTGRVITPVGNFNDEARSIALQPDGKTVVAGFSGITTSNNDFALVRYNVNGSLDATFGTGGKVMTNVGDAHDAANSVLLQPDGKIVAAGFTNNGTSEDFAIIRYNPDGTLDPTFGIGGKVVTSIGSGNDVIHSINLQTDGKLVAVGKSDTGSGSAFAIARYQPNGTLDATFGVGGLMVSTTISEGNEEAFASVIDAQGRIVAAGFGITYGQADFAVARYTDNCSGTPPTPTPTPVQTPTPVLATPTPTPAPTPTPGGALYTRGDYDGDNKTDLTVWRPVAFEPNLSAFYTYRSSDASFFGIQFGNVGDVAIAGDFDGDNKTDFGVSRFTTADGVDLVYLESSTNTAKFPVWGNTGDVFISGDYDGDKKTDVMAWRPFDGTWYIVNSSGSNGGFSFIQHGQSLDKPYAMDTDGDGKANLVYFRPQTGDWVVRNNDGSTTTTNFGLSTDIPVPADYDGDNKDDIAVFRDGLWIVLKSSTGQVEFMPFGAAGDIPVPGDYDGDNLYDRAVYREGIWHMLRSSQGYTGFQFGAPTDTAMPKAYIP